MKFRVLIAVTATLGLSGCTNNKIFGGFGGGSSNNSHTPRPVDGANEGFEPSKNLKKGNTVWKRYRAFEQGLMAGLELSKNQLCNEMGSFSCVDKVHLTILGGNEAFDSAQHERLQDPSILTSVAVSRVLLSACSQRADLDEQSGVQGAAVFKHFALTGSGTDGGAVTAQATELYKRLLARTPTQQELSAISAAKDNFTSPKSLAIAMCYAIGSHIENIFI